MGKYPGLTNQGKSLVDITAVVFVVVMIMALAAWLVGRLVA